MLSKKPIQQILTALNGFMQLTVFLLAVSLIDLFTSDWVAEAHQSLENDNSLVKLGLRSFLRADLELCHLSAKLGLHDNIQVVLLACLILIPLFLYTIKVRNATDHIFSLFLLDTKYSAKTL